MLQRSNGQPVASLKEEDVNNIRFNRRQGSPLCTSAPKVLDKTDHESVSHIVKRKKTLFKISGFKL